MKAAKSLIILIFLTGGLVLAFAGGQAEKEKPIKLVYWTHEDPNRTLLEEAYIEEFKIENPQVLVVRETTPSKKMKEKILTAFAAGKGPDIFNRDSDEEFQYIVNGRVAPVNISALGYKNLDALIKDYLPGTFDGAIYKGKLYGLPLEITNWCIFMNNRYFKEVGLDPGKDHPKTWEQMVNVAEKLTIRDGEVITRRGFDFRYPYYFQFLVPMVNQLGGTVLSKDRKTAAIDSPDWIKVLDYMQQWGPNGLNLGTPTYKNARRTFNKDDNSVAMCTTGLYQVARIRKENPDLLNYISIVPYPRFKDAVNDNGCAIYGHYLMVNSQASKENQEAAWKLIMHMVSHVEDYVEKCGLIIPSKELLASAKFKSIKWADVFTGDLSKSNFVFLHKDGQRIQEVIRELVEAVMLTEAQPADAAGKAKAKINEILKESL